MNQPTYKDAGVDLELYGRAMQRLPDLMARTHTARVMELKGGFAGLFRLQDATHTYRDPVLVSGTDGVGTKIKVARALGRFDTIGIDLVAMCVNDCLCLGAEPLFFLDYLALGKDDPELIAELVAGVSEGCCQAGAALLGGETAIMPDVYADGEFDLAGFCVAVAERDTLIDGSQIAEGDAVLGLPSHGFHSNGYSLIRRVVFDLCGMQIGDRVPELQNQSVGDVLLKPTRIYTADVGRVLNARRSAVHGIAHITGGGLAENLQRILPAEASVELLRGSWQVPSEMAWLQSVGNIAGDEMDRVFNMGIGLVLVVAEAEAEAILALLQESGTAAVRIGRVVSGGREVRILDTPSEAAQP